MAEPGRFYELHVENDAMYACSPSMSGDGACARNGAIDGRFGRACDSLRFGRGFVLSRLRRALVYARPQSMQAVDSAGRH